MNTNSLLHGPIVKALVKLALPIMGTAFLQMAYNMTDMIWLGHLSSNAVASSGTAGFFMWFGMGLVLISKIGTEIGVSQSIGRGEMETAKTFVRNAIQLNIFLSVVFGLFLYLFRVPLIEFFRLGDAGVIRDAVVYLAIVALGMPFALINPVFSSVYNGYGNSRTPFLINTVGLIFNIVVDPLLIFGIGPFPVMGVAGAAWATILAQLIVTLIFVQRMFIQHEPLGRIHLFHGPDWAIMRRITGYGLPVAIQSGMFTIFSILIARIISQWGPLPIAVQKVGSQIESISWMTANGFATALATFVGQNYGAGQWKRIIKGYFAAIGLMSCIGIAATVLLVFAGAPIFSLFIPEAQAIAAGAVYLKILGYSQLFMCIEITTAGAFNGLGKTLPPAVSSILLTGARVPAALILSSPVLLGLEGVWWSISISSIIKGLVIIAMFVWFIGRIPEVQALKKTADAEL